MDTLLPEQRGISPSAAEEIKILEQKLAEKKREAGLLEPEPHEEKKLFREVMREHVAQIAPAPSSAPQRTEPSITPLTPANALPAGIAAPSPSIKEEATARELAIQGLIETALTKGIGEAVRSADKEGFFSLDELHDRLADEYYDKLVELRKIINIR